jgi:hypothetical protein
MAQLWKERLNPAKHLDFMACTGGGPTKSPRDNLIESWVYFVQTPDCTLQFVSPELVEEARTYFSQKIHPARRQFNNGLEHCWQRWFERLPPGVHREPNRLRILDALQRLIAEIAADRVPERQ